jgi:hypothetical protein
MKRRAGSVSVSCIVAALLRALVMASWRGRLTTVVVRRNAPI